MRCASTGVSAYTRCWFHHLYVTGALNFATSTRWTTARRMEAWSLSPLLVLASPTFAMIFRRAALATLMRAVEEQCAAAYARLLGRLRVGTLGAEAYALRPPTQASHACAWGNGRCGYLLSLMPGQHGTPTYIIFSVDQISRPQLGAAVASDACGA